MAPLIPQPALARQPDPLLPIAPMPAARGAPAFTAPRLALSETQRPAAPPPQARADPAPIQGDVYFDGERVGRWLGSHLARRAARPPAGATGFDPRLSPLWPGATIGP
jgi:hypothetical protein